MFVLHAVHSVYVSAFTSIFTMFRGKRAFFCGNNIAVIAGLKTRNVFVLPRRHFISGAIPRYYRYACSTVVLIASITKVLLHIFF